MSLRIYINERLIDTYPDQVVALTYQTNELSEVRDRQATYSNTFKVPRTRNNRRILGNADIVTSASRVPYTYLACRVIQDGVNITPDAVAEVSRVEEDFELTIFARVVSFWTKIDGLVCIDAFPTSLVDPIRQQYSHFRTAKNVKNFNLDTNAKLVYPIVQYLESPPSQNNTKLHMDTRYFFPAIFAKDIIKQIISSAGYILNTDLELNPLFDSLVIPYSGDATADTFSLDNLVPDMSQRDFLKAMAFVFGVNFIQKKNSRNTIITEPFDKPITNENVIWSDKLDFSKPIRIEHKWGEWGIDNRFGYTKDDLIDQNAFIDLPFSNVTAKKHYEAVVLPFAMSLNNPAFQGQELLHASIRSITALDETTQNVTQSKTRKLRLLKLGRTQKTIDYTDRFYTETQTSGVPYAWFPDELRINNILEEKYVMLRRIFSSPQRLTAYFNLSTIDIENLDLSKPVFLNVKDINGMYLISRVVEYQQGQTTKVELVRMGSAVPVPVMEDAGFLVDSQVNYLIDSDGGKVTSA